MTQRIAESDNENQEVSKKKSEVDIDWIIAEEIGQFGWHQLRTVSIVLVFILLGGMKSGDYSLVTARIETRCFIPECENNTVSEFKPHWISYTIPKTNEGSFDQCHKFARNASSAGNSNNTCSFEDFGRNKIVKCEKYVYENHNTVVYDFDLGCDEWRRTFIGSIQSLAYFISIPLTGYISDRWGRKTAFVINIFGVSLFGLSRYWTVTFNSYLILGFIMSIFSAGYYPSGYILVMEVVGPKYRVLMSALVSVSLSLGQSSVAPIAWLVPEWRKLTLFIYSPTLVIVLFWYFLSNSPRWYLSKNRYKEAEIVLKDMAHMNNKEISEKAINALKTAAEEELREKTLEEKKAENEPWLPVLVFRHKPVLIRCIVTPVWWFTFVLIYYSLTFNSVNLSGNPYLSLMAVNLIDIPGFFIGMILLNKVGRRRVLLGSFLLCATSQIAYLFINKEAYGPSLTLFLMGKLCVSVVVQVVYLYTAELYPTKYRNSLLAFSSTVGRIGNIIAPLTPAFGEKIPFILYASFCLLSGLLMFVTPETRGTMLPDTMEDASRMSKVNCHNKNENGS